MTSSTVGWDAAEISSPRRYSWSITAVHGGHRPTYQGAGDADTSGSESGCGTGSFLGFDWLERFVGSGMSRIGTGPTHRSAAALLVASAVIVAACSPSHTGDGKADRRSGGGAEGPAVKVEATPAFLARAATRSAAKPYRVRIDMRSNHYGKPVTVARGMVAGDDESYSLNYGAMLEVLAGGLGLGSSAPGPLAKDRDLTIDTVSKPPMFYVDMPALVLYLRQPALAEFPRTRGRTADVLAPLLDRQAEWRRVDVRRLGTATPADVQAVLAGQRLDPTAYLE